LGVSPGLADIRSTGQRVRIKTVRKDLFMARLLSRIGHT
jgi:hypothetical protein